MITVDRLTRRDVTLTQCVYYVLGMVLSLLVGFMLGVLIRSSTGAIVAYFVLTFLLPTLLGLLAANTSWFPTLQPWVDWPPSPVGSGRTSRSPGSSGWSCPSSSASAL